MFELVGGLFGLTLGIVKLAFGLAMFLPVVLYFVPAIIAIAGKKRQAGWIVATNLLFGWTVVGWLAALVWALVGEQRGATLYYRRLPH